MAIATLTSVLQQLRTIAHARAYEDTSDRDLLERFVVQREEAAFVALMAEWPRGPGHSPFC